MPHACLSPQVWRMYDTKRAGQLRTSELPALLTSLGLQGEAHSTLMHVLSEQALVDSRDGTAALKKNMPQSPIVADLMQMGDAAATAATAAATAGPAKYVTQEQFLHALGSEQLFEWHHGRFLVAICLTEAETIRAAMHMTRQAHRRLLQQSGGAEAADKAAKGQKTAVALWLGTHLLEASEGYTPMPEQQAQQGLQCLRFLNSELHFSEQQQLTMLRALRSNKCSERSAFFSGVRACRRRAQQQWQQQSSVSRLFRTATEWELVRVRAAALRMGSLVLLKQLLPLTAFTAFNSSGSGKVCPDLPLFACLPVCACLRVCRPPC